MKYKLAIFDLDGTVLDTLEDLTDSTNFALRSCGYPERTVEEVRRFVGNGIRNLMRRAVPEDCSEEEVEQSLAFFKNYYKIHSADKTRPYEGILEVLLKLREQGVKTAVVSNKADFAVQDLCRFYFDGIFDFVVGERDGIARKPAPDSVKEVLMQLGMEREASVYIGDSEVDVETAANAEMDCIAVTWGFREEALLRQHGACVLASSPEELLYLLS